MACADDQHAEDGSANKRRIVRTGFLDHYGLSVGVVLHGADGRTSGKGEGEGEHGGEGLHAQYNAPTRAAAYMISVTALMSEN